MSPQNTLSLRGKLRLRSSQGVRFNLSTRRRTVVIRFENMTGLMRFFLQWASRPVYRNLLAQMRRTLKFQGYAIHLAVGRRSLFTVTAGGW